MSGWIKMGTGLRRHPKVVRISSALDADRLRIIGALHVVWCLFDEHSKDGKLFGYTPAVLDEELGWPGFSAAMQEVGWLEVFEGHLSVPSYEEHNGPTAKRRATDAQRKGKVRKSSAECPQDVRTESGQMSACDADKTRNREEKRREEKNTPLPPAGAGEGRFPEFWSEWPSTERKADRKKCVEKWRRNRWDALADVIVAHVKAMKETRQWKDGYEPAPLTYLNGERWRDGIPAQGAPGGSATADIFAGAR